MALGYTIVWSGIHACNECTPRQTGMTTTYPE